MEESCVVFRLADEPLCSDRLASEPTSRCPSESTVAAGHWCSRSTRAATGFADRKNIRRFWSPTSGQKRLASSGNTLAIAGEPPKSRIVLSIFENMEKAQAGYTSPDYLEAQKIGDKYARLRIFAVEGVSQ